MENIYAPPTADLQDDPQIAQTQFYTVSPPKFWILYIATLSGYGVYWFYKHWATIRKNTGAKLWPLPRAIFAIFFTHSLFDRFHRTASAASMVVSGLNGVATMFVMVSILERIVSRMSAKGFGSPYTDAAELILLPVAGWFLYRAQSVANLANGDPGGRGNARLTWGNWVWIVLGVLVWGLVVIGLLDTFGVISLDTETGE